MALDNSTCLRGKPLVGIGSYAFRYAIGFDGFRPADPMTTIEFLIEASRMGFQGVQLCENLNIVNLGKNELSAINDKACELGMFVEVGMRGLTAENIARHLEIGHILSSRFLRVVLGKNGNEPETHPEVLRTKAIKILNDVLIAYPDRDLIIGIENHFDLHTSTLVEIVKEINDDRVGLILDTTNCLGFIQSPYMALDSILPHIKSIHLKDYIVRKIEAGFMISGAPLGEGLLNVRKILTTALKANPNLSIIIELTIRREEQQTMEEVIAWEKDAIIKSIDYLHNCLKSLDEYNQDDVKLS
jgi:3-oxoisoapionate decarboxylase